MKKSIIPIALIALSALSCIQTEDPSDKVKTEFDESPVSVTKPSSTGYAYEVGLSASESVEWTAAVTEGEEWISLSTSSGKGTGKIIYNLTSNTGVGKRTGKITVEATCPEVSSFSAQKTITVSQLGTEPYLTIDPSGSQSVEYSVSELKVSVSSNVSWKASLSVSENWISISSGATGENAGEVILALTSNETGAVREATLTIAYVDDSSVFAAVNIEQQYKGIAYTIEIPAMTGVIPDGVSEMSVTNGTAKTVDVVVKCANDTTTIEFETALDPGLWTLTSVGSVNLGAQFTVGTGGVVVEVETWNQAFGCFGGDSEERPIKISSEKDLAALAASVADTTGTHVYSGKYFLQTCDITLTSANWPGIGIPVRKFGGNYNGNGHSVKGLRYETNDLSASDENRGRALFNHVKGHSAAPASIKNLSVYASDTLIAKFGNASGIVAHISDSVTIDNCHNYAPIICCTAFSSNGGAFVGGVLGWVSGAGVTVKNCSNNAPIIADRRNSGSALANNVGGVCGSYAGVEGFPAIMSNCSNCAPIRVLGNAGGVVGNCGGNASFTCLANYGDITSPGGNARVGGVIGSMSGAAATISESFNKGDIIGYVNTGGVVGLIESGASVTNCYNKGNMTVTGKNTNNGGVVGHKKDASSPVSYCYSCGQITDRDGSMTNFGGVCGSNLGTAADIIQNITSCIYESGQGAIKAFAKNPDTSVDESTGTSKTADEMKSGSVFFGWSTTVWTFSSGHYPSLVNNPEK